MALAEVHFYSNSVGLSMAMNVILPDSGPGPFPVFYLLHGLSDDHTMWCRRSNIERYIEKVPMIVVMPETGRGWYTNSKNHPGRACEDMMIKDVIPLVDRIFPTIKTRAGRVVGGLSMGGYGAVKLALKYPDMFCSATSHSGAVLGPLQVKNGVIKPRVDSEEFAAILGPKCVGTDNDPVALAKKCPKAKRPALRIDCGVDDFLILPNRSFDAQLTKMGYEHEYQEFPGGHTWEYWDTHVQEALTFHRRQLGI